MSIEKKSELQSLVGSVKDAFVPKTASSPPDKSPSTSKPERKRFQDRYLISALLGRGRFGRVYLAHDGVLERDVAIKTFEPDPSLIQDVDFKVLAKAFRREAQVLAKLNHPNIVPVYDFGETGNSFFIVMKYVEGTQLSAKGLTLSFPSVVRLFSKIAEALHAVHNANPPIVHRDIKLQNILLDRNEEPYLIDFNLVRFWTLEQTVLGWKDVFKCSPSYASPEVVDTVLIAHESRADLPAGDDPRSDLWQLGNCMYRLLTGHKPVELTDVSEYCRFVADRQPITPVAQHRPDVPKALGDIVMKLLAYEPNDRFQSAKDLQEALVGIPLGGEEGQKTELPKLDHRPATEVEDGAREGALEKFLPDNQEKPTISMKRKVLSAAVIVLGLSVIGLKMLGNKPPTPKGREVVTAPALLVQREPIAPASPEDVKKALGKQDSVLLGTGTLSEAFRTQERTRTKPIQRPQKMSVVYQRKESSRSGDSGRGTVVWKRQGLSVGQSKGLGILRGTLFEHVVTLNKIVSFNMDTPVRAQLEADLERDGRVLLPQKSIILGVAKAAKAVDRVQVVFDTIVTPEHKEISFRGIAMMPDGSQGLVGEVDLQKDKSTLAGVGAALSTTSRAAISAADPTGFGAQLGANVADETLQNMDKDLNQAGRVDRIISVNAYTPIQIFVDETF